MRTSLTCVRLVLRRTPYATDSAAGRSNERYRRAALSILAAAAAKGVAMLAAIVTVPLTLDFLGAERYGLWVTMVALVSMLSFADMGIGNGLITVLARAHGRNDRDGAHSYFSSALLLVSSVALALGTIFAFGYSLVPWPQAFNVTEPLARAEAGPATAAFVVTFLLAIPVSLVQKVQLAFQEGYVNSVWQIIGTLASLACIVLVVHFEASLPWLVVAATAGAVLASVGNGLLLFGWRRRWLLPRWRAVRADAVRTLLRLGTLFFALQLVVAIAFTSDNLIVAHLWDAATVPRTLCRRYPSPGSPCSPAWH